MAAFFKLPRRATGMLRAALLATVLLLTGCASLPGSELPPPARERLAAFVAFGYEVPKARVATKPTRGSKERRLGAKRERSTIKRGRATRDWD